MIKGFGHIGVVVKDIDKSVADLAKALNTQAPPVKSIPEKNMKVALFEIGDVGLEFIEDDNEDGAFAKVVKERGNSIHHFCLLSDDMQADIDTLKGRGVEMADQQPKIGLRGKPIAFTKPSVLDGIPIELSTP